MRDHHRRPRDQHREPVSLPCSIGSSTRLEIIYHLFQAMYLHRATWKHCIGKESEPEHEHKLHIWVSHDERQGKNHRRMLSECLAMHSGVRSQNAELTGRFITCVSIVLQAGHQRVAGFEIHEGH